MSSLARFLLAMLVCACGTSERASPRVTGAGSATAATGSTRTESDAAGTTTPPADAAAPSDAIATASIEELFRGYETALPKPATLSEMNGASLECPTHGSVTYTLLDGTARRLPVTNDTDLVRLVPWARSRDVCLRQIAVKAIVQRVGFDPNRLSLPAMHDPEHHLFHEIMVVLRTYLVGTNTTFQPDLFAGLFLDVAATDIAAFHGRWSQVTDESDNFQHELALTATGARLTRRFTKPQPGDRDEVETLAIDRSGVNDKGQIALAGHHGKDPSGSQQLLVWPVAKDVVWFHRGVGPWLKLRRAK